MRTGTTAHAGLGDARSLVYEPRKDADMPHPRRRRTIVLGIAAVPLSLLFAWFFVHLVLGLVFPVLAGRH